MERILFDFLFLTLGMGLGVMMMCLMQAGKEADKEMERLKESEDK
ncbi:conjugative transposon protein [Clostridioides difficile]|nr:conjugative transposon protein [Clostridioides difficile]